MYDTEPFGNETQVDETRADNLEGELIASVSFKNVDAEAVRKLRLAARKDGMKIGAWVSHHLKEAAESRLNQPSDPADKIEGFDEIAERFRQFTIENEKKLDSLQIELLEIASAQRSILSYIVQSKHQSA